MSESSPARGQRPPLLPIPHEIRSPAEHVSLLWPGIEAGRPAGVKTIRLRSAPVGQQESALGLRRPPKDAAVDAAGEKPSTQRRLAAMHERLRALEGQPNVDCSISVFKRWRRADQLLLLTALVLDFDVGVLPSGEADIEAVESHIGAVDVRANQLGLPPANLVVRTGRGFHLYWLFDRPLPAIALPRWRAAQDWLIKRFEDLRPDAGVCDPTRVLRLTGTLNTKVRQVDGQYWRVKCEVRRRERHCFDHLATAILPLSRNQIYELREARAAKLAKQLGSTALHPRAARAELAGTPQARGMAIRQTERATAQYAWLLRSIMQAFGGLVPADSGCRDKILFAAACSLAWMVPADALASTVSDFAASYLEGLSTSEVLRERCCTVLRRATAAQAERTSGQLNAPYDDPRYVLSHRWFEKNLSEPFFKSISEVKGLQGRAPRASGEYTGAGVRRSNLDAAIRAHEMRSEGMSLAKIGAAFGKAAKTVREWLLMDVDALRQAKARAERKEAPPRRSKDQSTAALLQFPRRAQEPSNVPLTQPPEPARREESAVLPQSLPKSPLNGSPAHIAEVFTPRPRGGGSGGGAAPPSSPVDNSKSGSAEVVKLVVSPDLRAMTVPQVLEALGCVLKADATYRPHDAQSVRYHVTSPAAGQVVELIVTGELWWAGADRGGGRGGISAGMKLLDLKFGQVLKRLGSRPVSRRKRRPDSG